MKALKWAVGIVVLLLVAFGAIQMMASEGGEVVVLTTMDETGSEHTTRLWVVEHDGHTWLRAGIPDAEWYLRLKANPLVRVERNEVVTAYKAIPVPGQRDAINGLMLQKYGWSERYISAMMSREASVPIRLEVD
jgi:hypothetical protein